MGFHFLSSTNTVTGIFRHTKSPSLAGTVLVSCTVSCSYFCRPSVFACHSHQSHFLPRCLTQQLLPVCYYFWFWKFEAICSSRSRNCSPKEESVLYSQQSLPPHSASPRPSLSFVFPPFPQPLIAPIPKLESGLSTAPSKSYTLTDSLHVTRDVDKQDIPAYMDQGSWAPNTQGITPFCSHFHRKSHRLKKKKGISVL